MIHESHISGRKFTATLGLDLVYKKIEFQLIPIHERTPSVVINI